MNWRASRFVGLLYLVCLGDHGAPPDAPLRLIARNPVRGPGRGFGFSTQALGWMASSRDVWITEDGGRSWKRSGIPAVGGKYSPAPEIVGCECAARDCVTITVDGRVLHSVDNGGTWSQAAQPAMGEFPPDLKGVRVQNGLVWVYGGVYRPAVKAEILDMRAGVRAGDGTRMVLDPVVLLSRDGGTTLTRQKLPSDVRSDGRVIDLAVLGTSAVLTTGSQILHATDWGDQWKPSHIYGPRCRHERSFEDGRTLIRHVYLFPNAGGMLSPDDGSLYRTNDGGATWCEIAPPGTIHPALLATPSRLESLVFSTPDLGWAAEFAGTLMKTNDGGRTWTSILAQGESFERVFGLNSKWVWALSDKNLYRVGPHM